MLTADEIGTIALLATFFGLFKTVAYLGSQTGISREYLHEAKSDEEKLVVISTGNWGLLVIVGIFSLPPYLFCNSHL